MAPPLIATDCAAKIARRRMMATRQKSQMVAASLSFPSQPCHSAFDRDAGSTDVRKSSKEFSQALAAQHQRRLHAGMTASPPLALFDLTKRRNTHVTECIRKGWITRINKLPPLLQVPEKL